MREWANVVRNSAGFENFRQLLLNFAREIFIGVLKEG